MSGPRLLRFEQPPPGVWVWKINRSLVTHPHAHIFMRHAAAFPFSVFYFPTPSAFASVPKSWPASDNILPENSTIWHC